MPSSNTSDKNTKKDLLLSVLLLSVLESNGVHFQIKSGKATYKCHLQDRASYEGTKATRRNSSQSFSTRDTQGTTDTQNITSSDPTTTTSP
ncbi:hypothetical protein CMUS01_02056 [Colletotrichum musicola]|uniref:Uncharacterized protein n=1 Tax=Colletotrichum musicola TaxID=2175873 RepID=A0A8H6NW11_9PEZI|nr:hypothetical protein CMUS01_02056 [Colletotrichum musicola]